MLRLRLSWKYSVWPVLSKPAGPLVIASSGPNSRKSFHLRASPSPSGNLPNLAAGRRVVDRQPHVEVVVGEIAGDAGVLLDELLLAGLDVDPPDVVKLRVAIVEADEDFVGKLLADFLNLGADAFDRREVLGLAACRRWWRRGESSRRRSCPGCRGCACCRRPNSAWGSGELFPRHRLGLRQVVAGPTQMFSTPSTGAES